MVIRVSQWSSQRTSASAWNSIDSSTSSHAWSATSSAPAFSRVSSWSERSVAVRCVWTTAWASTPGVVSAIAILIASSSRGRPSRITGVVNQRATSARPASVSR